MLNNKCVVKTARFYDDGYFTAFVIFDFHDFE